MFCLLLVYAIYYQHIILSKNTAGNLKKKFNFEDEEK